MPPEVKIDFKNPTRTASSTGVIHGAALSPIPVKASGKIPKALVKQAVRLLDNVVIEASVAIGIVAIADILGISIDFITVRIMEWHEEVEI